VAAARAALTQPGGSAQRESKRRRTGSQRDRAGAAGAAAAADGLADLSFAAPTDAPVFVKVWRQGDEGVSLKWMRSEMELLQPAHRVGVPCPQPMAELTAVSIEREGSTYHRLAMRRLADDPVLPEDVDAYAAATLVGAVLRLHGAGVLHCDVKPRNVLWDAAVFGHAQREAGAEACAGTPGYTDPRVGARGGAAQPKVGRVQRRQNDPRGWETRGGRHAFTPDVEGLPRCRGAVARRRRRRQLLRLPPDPGAGARRA
jgi:hypothetical protein